MKISSTDFESVYIIDTDPHQDHRGTFGRWFCQRELSEILQNRTIAQINNSASYQIGTIRGMHYQIPPHAETKLIRCTAGRVFDVVVDLRPHSPTFLQWRSYELSAENGKMIHIPEGCAHGFQVLEENSELLYIHTEFYTPEAERAIRFDDPKIGIKWPLSLTNISERDQSHPYIDDNFSGAI